MKRLKSVTTMITILISTCAFAQGTSKPKRPDIDFVPGYYEVVSSNSKLVCTPGQFGWVETPDYVGLVLGARIIFSGFNEGSIKEDLDGDDKCRLSMVTTTEKKSDLSMIRAVENQECSWGRFETRQELDIKDSVIDYRAKRHSPDEKKIPSISIECRFKLGKKPKT